MVFNFISFQSAWLIAVNFKHSGVLILVAILILHFIISHHRLRDAYAVGVITLVGCLVDASASYAGLFVFTNGELIPLWLMLLWANFAITFHYSMAWLARFHTIIQAILGGVFGCLSYYTAYKLGAVDYPFEIPLTIFSLIVIWSVTLPVYISIAATIRGINNDRNENFLSH